jgi:hypothetical protein
MTDLLAQSLANLANARNTVLEEMKNRYPVGSEVSWKAGKGFSTGHVIGHAPFWTREPTRLQIKPIRNGKARWVTPYNIPLASYAAPPAQAVCSNCDGAGAVPYTFGQTPEQFEQGEYPCPECTPAQGIDLGQLRKLAQGWIDHAARAPRDDWGISVYDDCGNEILALIDQRDAGPGVGNG